MVVVGAHLDSVVEVPGINDNGSGSSTILEIAEEMARVEPNLRQKVRFAFWGVFEKYFAGQGLATDPTAFGGRSDYGPFITAGIPAGGLFSGAEGIKTQEQAAVYGGTAGAAPQFDYRGLDAVR